MTGLKREIARRQAQAAKTQAPPKPAPPVTCSAGNEAARCCVGDPWADLDIGYVRTYGEPLPLSVIRVAAERGIDPHSLDWHVEAVHGWEPHDVGYDERVPEAAECVARGTCRGVAAMTFDEGGYIPSASVPTPIRLHPDECLLASRQDRWVCVRGDHRGREAAGA